MVTGKIKREIENVWNIFWSGGMTNPLTIVEQITYLLFIKMLDDNQRKAEAAACKTPYPVFDEAHQDCRWSVFRLYEPEAMFQNMTDRVFPFIRGELCGRGAAYSKYVKEALFLIPSPRVLTSVVAAFDSLDLEDRDIMGDVYETILGQMGQSGKNGQFRTPRHIIRMMIELARPTPEDTICDPAMGTAGFLCAAARYLAEHNAAERTSGEKTTPLSASIFTGFDTDQTMLRIAAMNLMLHGIEDPSIQWQDSLSEQNTCRERFSLILANPPFAGSLDQEAIAEDLRPAMNQQTHTAQTEVLFLYLFIQMLKTGGRCVSIVPGGLLSASTRPHRMIRKELVDRQRLEAVIAMPGGVFQPYTGASTAILVFTKTNRGGTGRVWFYNMKADGLSMSSNRRPSGRNDIPDILHRFHRLEQERERTRSDQSFLVSREEIAENDYSLHYERYYKPDGGEGGEAASAKLRNLLSEARELLERSEECDKALAGQLEAMEHET